MIVSVEPVSRCSATSGKRIVETTSTRAGSGPGFVTACAPPSPLGKASTAPAGTRRGPAGVRTTGLPDSTTTSSSLAWWAWYGEIAPPASISYSVAPSSSAPACAPARIALARNGASGISASHSGSRMFGSSLILIPNLPPYPVRCARDRPQLGLLVLDRQVVAEDRRGEAALGADAEAVEVD